MIGFSKATSISEVSDLTNLSTRFFLRKMLGAWYGPIYRDPISLILGTRFAMFLGTGC